MELVVLGSSSKGNCYILNGRQESLVIECGVPFRKVQMAIDFDLSRVSGAIVSHSHLDHAGYVSEFMDNLIYVWSFDDYKSKNGRKSKRFENKKKFNVGEFEILPLKVVHDVPCFSFMINHPESGLIYFVTDTHYIPYKVNNVNHLILESNYSQEIIDSNGSMPFLRERIINSHLSVENAIDWYKKIDSSSVKNIVLTHLSDTNSNEKKFKEMFVGASGKPVYVANYGLKVELLKSGRDF